MKGWNRITSDHSSAGVGGFRTIRPDRGPALKIGTVLTADALVDDVVVTLPLCVPNAGRLFLVVRLDDSGSLTTVTVEPNLPSSESIVGLSSYDGLTSQWSSVLLLATDLGVWLILSEWPL